MADTLGLVAGAGTLPVLMAREARRAGWRVVAFALADSGPLAAAADRTVPSRLDAVGPILELLAAEGIRHVVLGGRVSKQALFRGAALDGATQAIVEQSADWTDDGLLSSAAAVLAAMGIQVLDQRQFLAPWLAGEGLLAGPEPVEAVESDIRRGLAVARDVARHGIGQAVVLRAGSIAAVEAMEGTDAAIRRGLELAGPGAVVVKATARAHDYRFDVPTVGMATVALCAAGHAAALAVEAGRVLLVERDAVAAQAADAGLSLVGVDPAC